MATEHPPAAAAHAAAAHAATGRKFFSNGHAVAELQQALAMEAGSRSDSASASQKQRPWFEGLAGVNSKGCQRQIVLFDGMCRLCMGFVSFVVGRDADDLFQKSFCVSQSWVYFSIAPS